MSEGDVGFLQGYLPYLLRRADQTLSEGFYGVLTDQGIARSEWRVLAVLEELGALSVLDLADASLSPQPTVTHAVQRLEERGLVTRSPGIVDKRQRIVAITTAGTKLTRTLMSEAKRRQATTLATAGDLGELRAQLQRLTTILETATVQAGELES